MYVEGLFVFLGSAYILQVLGNWLLIKQPIAPRPIMPIFSGAVFRGAVLEVSVMTHYTVLTDLG